MGRKGPARKRPDPTDPKFGDVTAGRFINAMMLAGKRSTATRLLYAAFDEIEKKTGEPPLDLFLKAVTNVRPTLEVKSRRVGGSTYQVPIEVRDSRREALAIRWLIQYAKQRSGRSMSASLSAELIDASNETGAAVKRKEDTHRMAEANKAFAHYRW
jgi:small subunit ribosomal protein S7